MIAVDWGTSSFRAYRLAPDGATLDRRDAPRGIMQVEGGRFADVLRDAVGPWLAEGESRVLLGGMIGSRQGWVEAPYVPCPAGLDELAAGLVAVPFEGAAVRLVPGLRHGDEHGVPEVMRGEEVQIMGALPDIGADGLVCLPGTHSKWARVRAGRVEGFATHMTGEAYAALRGHTILGRMMRDGPTDPAAFLRGVERAGQPGGLLHHLFGVRTLGLFGALAESEAAGYLSGLLIGHELRAAMPTAGPGKQPEEHREGRSEAVEVHLIGAPALCVLYQRAIEACGGRAVAADSDAAARGLYSIGSRAAWN